MNKFIRLFALLALVMLSIASFATVRAQQPVQLTLEGWSSTPNENQMLQQIIDTFNKNNPDIQVKLNQVPDYDTTLAKDLASGTPPDVFYVESFRLLDLVNAGALEPIGDKIENPDDF
jgi:multiple sugar transport system substrate-binding protein